MPIYEYQCDSCEHKLEIIQKISDEPMKFCPECGRETLRKLISPVSFRLKGTGWYETDFKNKKPAAADPAGKSKETETGKKESAEKTGTKDSSSTSGSTTADSTG